MFPYMVDSTLATGGGAVPAFHWHTFDPSHHFHIENCGLDVTPLPVVHGMYYTQEHAARKYMCMGFRLGDISYISDVNEVPRSTKPKIDGTRILILDALRVHPHKSHFGFQQVTPLGEGE
jgi:phosphoribosyl 1,2-cyclic phosphodiesterase